jgi:predicted adenylyl cyclase CyaB
MTNFEFKARLADATQVQSVMAQRGAEVECLMQHNDTYFRVASGRLKLREIAFLPVASARMPLPPSRCELIYYQREDDAGVKRSDYLITPVADAESMRDLLTAALGIRVAVKKRRTLYLLGYAQKPHAPQPPHIRVHLDEVEALGNFVEVEAVLGKDIAPESARAEAQALLDQFGVKEADLITGSYADLLEIYENGGERF